MTVYFINKTKSVIMIQFGDNVFEIRINDRIKIDSKANRIVFSCSENNYSSFHYFLSLKSIISRYNFILKSICDITLNNDTVEILLVEKEFSGEHLDEYKMVFPVSKNIVVNDIQFCVSDENLARNQISNSKRKESKIVKVLRVLDILQTALCIGIPCAILFFWVWHISNILTALNVLIILIFVVIIGVVVGLIIKSFIKKFTSKFDNQKTDYYVNTNSFFDSKYIKSVFENTQ